MRRCGGRPTPPAHPPHSPTPLHQPIPPPPTPHPPRIQSVSVASLSCSPRSSRSRRASRRDAQLRRRSSVWVSRLTPADAHTRALRSGARAQVKRRYSGRCPTLDEWVLFPELHACFQVNLSRGVPGGGSEQEISPAHPHFHSDGGATSSGGHRGTHVEQKLSGRSDV